MNFHPVRVALRLALLTVIAATLWPQESHAYRLSQVRNVNGTTRQYSVSCGDPGGFLHRNSYRIRWWLNPSGQGSNKLFEVGGGVGVWDAVTPATYDGYLGGTTSRGKAYDGYNTILWSRPSCGGCLAVTWNWFYVASQTIIESDIEFDNGYTWTTNGSNYDTRAVLAHEWGHVLGINHTEVTSTPYPTMRASYFGSGGRSLEADDKNAANCIYNRYRPTYSATRAGGYETQSVEGDDSPPASFAIDAAIAEASDPIARAGLRANPDGEDEDIIADELAVSGTTAEDASGPIALSARMHAGRALLRFTLAKADRVVLEIFNVAGRRVSTVVDTSLEPGDHELVWSGNASSGAGAKAAPGMYFAKLRTSAGESSARVIFIR